MKVLTLVGVKPEEEDWQHTNRPLAYVYFKRWLFIGPKVLVVEPVSKELEAFATEVRRKVIERIENYPNEAFVCPNPTSESPHGRKIVKADDPNILDAIRSASQLWGRSGSESIAGYFVLSTYSKVEDRKV